MSYAICNIIYGCPIGNKAAKWFNRQKEYQEWEELGFETLYSGHSRNIPGYIGICLGAIDEATDANYLDLKNKTISHGDTVDNAISFSINPTEKQKQEVCEKYNILPESLKSNLPSIGIYLVWSTS